MLIGFATNRWKWNEWGKHPNICFNALIHVVMSCDILAIQNISWPFDLRERIFELCQFDRRTKVKYDSGFFRTLLCLQFSVTLVKQRGRTFALKIRFEQNDSIPPSYQFKREDMRLNLHCESFDWIEAFQLKKASLIAANLWLDFIFNVIQWRTLYMIFVPFHESLICCLAVKKIAMS